ncbi:MAG: hypothetical protein A2X12_04860 [Bacteroidetes bacterium GWE2_29_8]|nr:MAG: hypothetical protein A2X12_04860 [Bacteroidetes bacterium GWE2_29_8]
MKKQLISTIIIIITCLTVFGQYDNKGRGIPFIRNFNAKEYKGHVQNFCITQDKSRIIYIANFAGVIEFDGATWRSIPTSNRAKVSSVCIDNKGVIYVGGTGEIGYVGIDSSGKHQYISLLANLPKEAGEIQNVLSIFSTNEGICFVTNNNVIYYKDNKFKVITSNNNIISAFYVNNQIYLYQKYSGLGCIEKGKIQKIDKENVFTDATIVKSMLAEDNNTIIIATDNSGFYSLNSKNDKISELNINNNSEIKNKIISCGVKLKQGGYIYGTANAGIFILDNNKKYVQDVTKSKGIISDNVNNLFIDDDNELWVALDNGISRVEVSSMLSFFDNRNMIYGEVTDVLKFNGKLYISTMKGVYYKSEGDEKFNRVNNINMACWDMIVYKNRLFFGTSKGLFIEKGGGAELIAENLFVLTMRGAINDNKMYAGLINGLAIVDINNKEKTDIVQDIETEIRQIEVDKDGILWLNSPPKGIIKYDILKHKAEYLANKQGLPSALGNNLNLINGEIIITTVNGIMHYDSEKKTFVNMSILPENYSAKWYKRIIKDNNNGY